MRTSLRAARVAVGLLTLSCACVTLFGQNGAIQLTLRGGWASPAQPVQKLQVVGPYAYLVAGWAALHVVDVSSPTNPIPLGRYDAAQRVNGIHVDGHHAYLATSDWTTPTDEAGLLEVLDVSHPTNLIFVSGTQTRRRPNAVFVTGDLAYVAEGTWASESNRFGALEVFSVTNPVNPTVIGRYDTSTPVNDVKVVDHYAYLAGGGAALVILDVSDGHSPVWIGEFRTNGFFGTDVYGYAIEVRDRYAYLSSDEVGFFTLDIQNPSSPMRVSNVLPGRVDLVDFLYFVRVMDRYGCLTYMRRVPSGLLDFLGMRFFDMSNPADWIILGEYSEPASLVDLQLRGQYAYVAVTGGLLVYEITELPYFRSIAHSGDKIVLNWNDLPGLRLQGSASLSLSDWTDVPGSAGTNYLQLPKGTGPQFFRLAQP